MPETIPKWLILLAGFLTSFGITFFAIPRVIKLARLKGLYDLPGIRTSHDEPTPRLGGVTIFAGVILSSVLYTGFESGINLNYIIAGMLIVFFIGLKDDIISLSPIKKIIGQILASLVVVIPGKIGMEDYLYFLGWENCPVIIRVAVTVLIIMTLINCMNLIDGIDGLASGVGIIASAAFGFLFINTGNSAYAVICFSLTGSLIAFFYFNVFNRKNKIFLGDTGSMIIGFILALLAIHYLEINGSARTLFKNPAAPSLVLAVLIIPVFDTIRIILIRLYKKQPLFKADNNHLHHKILKLSGSHLKATMILLTANLFLIVLTLIFREWGNLMLISIIVVITAVSSTSLDIYLAKRPL